MAVDNTQYVVEECTYGACNLCSLELDSLHRVVGGAQLCTACLSNVAQRAHSQMSDVDSEFETHEDAFKHVLREHVGVSVVLYFPDQDSPAKTHSYTVTGVKDLGQELYEGHNEVHIEYVLDDGYETFSARGLRIASVSN